MFISCQIPLCILLFFILTISLVMYSNLLKLLFSAINSDVLVDLELETRFADYVAAYNRSYDPEEYLRRKQYFKESLKEISRLNALHGPPVFGVNKFSAMSPEEMDRLLPRSLRSECQHLGRKSCPHKMERDNTTYSDKGDIPLKFDWRDRDKRVVGKVVNQKMCSGCWAFSIVGVMESMWAIAGNNFYSLSIQELIDCSTYNNKCKGGDPGTALDFLCLFDYPIVSEAAYPLTLTGDSCGIHDHLPPGRRIAEFTSDCFVDEDFILRQVANHGPVVAVVNSRPWIFYNQGVIQRACPNEWGLMIHVVQIVGYDLTAEVPHYIVRNSWGTDFGNDGYVKLAVHHNVCGIASNVAYFTVK